MLIGRRRDLGTLLRGIVLLVIMVALVQTWLLDGLVPTYRVDGASMASTLLGVHREVVCVDCGGRFRCDSSRSPPVRAVCPNCGYSQNDVSQLPDVAGDRVLIDRSAFSLRAPRRWEVVALRTATSSEPFVVKRVVGLPGESIELRHGDVFVDGKIARKTLDEQRPMAILVHDARCSPSLTPDAPARWRPAGPDSRWTARHGTFHFAADTESQSLDWLVYHHWRRMPTEAASPPLAKPPRANSGVTQFQASPITDVCAYNATLSRREEDVHGTVDLILSMHVGCPTGDGALFIRLWDGGQGFDARLRFSNGRLAEWSAVALKGEAGATITSLAANGAPLVPRPRSVDAGLGATAGLSSSAENKVVQANGASPVPRSRSVDAGLGATAGLSSSAENKVAQSKHGALHFSPVGALVLSDAQHAAAEVSVEASLVDQQFLLALNGRTVAAIPFERSAQPTVPVCPVAIAAEGADVKVQNLQLYRDVYYVGRSPEHEADEPFGPTLLAPNEYYVLGDNSPASEDSRTWPAGTVRANLLLGQPTLAVSPAVLSPWRGWQFQVPNPLAIRYIR